MCMSLSNDLGEWICTCKSFAASSAKGVCVLCAVHHNIISPDI